MEKEEVGQIFFCPQTEGSSLRKITGFDKDGVPQSRGLTEDELEDLGKQE